MHREHSVYEDSTWEAIRFENEDLSECSSIVARGQFGASYMLGRIQTNRSLPPRVKRMIMMKSCNKKFEEKCYNGFQSELQILYDLCHENVVRLIGYCSDEPVDTLVLVLEYCSNGNLSKVLQKGRPYFEAGTYSPKKAINNEILDPGIFLAFCGWHLLRWATEISRGMEYLAFKGVVHGDLAARNILLTCDWTAKICNFGIGQRQKIQVTYAKQLQKEVLPIAWMAPEAIQNLTLSEFSDVWAFGITLWEIYSLGDIPYKEKNIVIDTRFWAMLLKGSRLSRPSHANDQIWDLMQSCWLFQSDQRPTFSKIKNFLEKTVLATRTEEESNLSGHSCKGGKFLKVEKPPRKKKVSFAPQVSGGLLRKCFYVADEILFRPTIKPN